jgi:hypothetical protein
MMEVDFHPIDRVHFKKIQRAMAASPFLTHSGARVVAASFLEEHRKGLGNQHASLEDLLSAGTEKKPTVTTRRFSISNILSPVLYQQDHQRTTAAAPPPSSGVVVAASSSAQPERMKIKTTKLAEKPKTTSPRPTRRFSNLVPSSSIHDNPQQQRTSTPTPAVSYKQLANKDRHDSEVLINLAPRGNAAWLLVNLPPLLGTSPPRGEMYRATDPPSSAASSNTTTSMWRRRKYTM